MQVNCPICKSAVLLTDESAELVSCQSCGESFRSDSGGDEMTVARRPPAPRPADQDSDPTALFRTPRAQSDAPPPLSDFPPGPLEFPPASPAESQLAARKQIGPYLIIRCIGRGGFGLVFLAKHEVLGREEAVKVPILEKFDSDDALRAFVNEAKVAVRLDHPHIVTVYHAGFAEDKTPFIAMKYIEGTTLASIMRDAQWSLPHVVALLVDVADALHHAHAREVVHRDLKPGNILIDLKGRAWVSDFGLALHASEQLNVRGDAAGTLRYSSPEQVRGQSEHMDGRTDIYSFGVILYEVLTGRLLFEGTRSQITEQILGRAPVPPSQRKEVPPELETLCLACLEKDVTRRPANMSMVAKTLRNWLQTASPDLYGDVSDTRRTEPAGPDQRSEHGVVAVSARTIAIATQPAIEPEEADLTTAPAASADTEKTVRAAPAELRRRPKVAALSTIGALLLLVAAAGVLLMQSKQGERPPLMDVRAANGAPVHLLNSDVFHPLPIIMPPNEVNFERIYNADRETLFLESPALCAVALGQVDKLADWQLDVSFSRTVPNGGSGAFWGFQPVPAGSPEERHTGGEPAWRMQRIWFEYQSPDRTFLRRHVEYFRLVGDQFHTLGSVGFGGHAVSLAEKRVQDISLSFRGPHLARVLWNGTPVPIDDATLFLTQNIAEAIGVPNPLSHSGAFGVTSVYGASKFERADFQYLGIATQ